MPDIRHQFMIKANHQRVFEALTSAKGLNAWWTLESSGTPQPGERYRFYFGPAHDWRADVISAEPGLSLTWQMTEAMEDWLPTQVGFKLTPAGAHTRVDFFHTNWQHTGDHFAISNFCWGQLLNGLKNYLELDLIVPFDLRNG